MLPKDLLECLDAAVKSSQLSGNILLPQALRKVGATCNRWLIV